MSATITKCPHRSMFRYALSILSALLFNVVYGASPVVLSAFSADTGSFNTISSLILGVDGHFYATATTGSPSPTCCGQIVRFDLSGTYSTIASLASSNGNYPNSLLLGSDGNFYGTAKAGGDTSCLLPNVSASSGLTGCGTVFRVTPGGIISTLATFNLSNGGWPFELIQGGDGNLYGLTFSGGNTDSTGPCYSNGCGTLFQVTPSGALTTLLKFDGTTDGKGVSTQSSIVYGSDGNLYVSSLDSVLKVTLSGTSTIMATPAGGGTLMLGKDGNFYGTDDGDIYQMTPNGAVTILKAFNPNISDPNRSDGWFPGVLMQWSDGNFYGTTRLGGRYLGGTVFEITPSGQFTSLYSLISNSGLSLTQGPDDKLYGTTGTTFFKLCDTCLAPPQGLTTTNVGNGSVSLRWNSVANAQSYNVYVYSSGSSIPATPTLTGITDTSVTVTGLSSTVISYSFVVVAVGNGGDSSYSNIAEGSPSATVPMAPTLSVYPNDTDGTALLRWTTPYSGGEPAAYIYNVYVGTSAGGENATAAYSNITSNYITVAAPAGAGTYYFRVTAINENGEGPSSNEVSASLKQLPLPVAPTLQFATPGPGLITLSWSSVSGASSYEVFLGTSAGGENSTPAQIGINSTSTTVSLINGINYFFMVKAVNASGFSPASNEVTSTPKPVLSRASSNSSSVASSSASSIASSSSGVASSPSTTPHGGGSVTEIDIAFLLFLFFLQRLTPVQYKLALLQSFGKQTQSISIPPQ